MIGLPMTLKPKFMPSTVLLNVLSNLTARVKESLWWDVPGISAKVTGLRVECPSADVLFCK